MRYNGNHRQPNHRNTIELYASESVLYEMIEQQIRNIKYRNKDLPQRVKQLPQNHFLCKLLRQSNLYQKYNYLEPFISPNDLMKAYNRRYARNRFVAVEIYYHYQPKFNNKNLQNQSDPKDFFFEVKNKTKQTKLTNVQKRIQTLMSAYLNKNKEILNDTMYFQSQYVVPQGYYPLISMKIKYDFISGFERKSGFQYLLLRFDQHRRFKLDTTSKVITEMSRKQNLKVNIQRKKIQKASKIQPQQIIKKQQLKTVYTIRNVSFGWIEVEESEYQKKQRFQTHFDIITLEDNIRYAQNRKNPKFATKTYLFFKKGEFQIPRIQILSFLFEQLVLKCVIKLNDIKKVSFFNSKNIRQIYLHVNTNPQFYFHMLDKNVANNLYNLTPWQRVQNFSIDFQNIFGKSLFMRNLLSQNSVICIDFRTGKNQFDKVVRYFSAQEIIDSQFMYEKPFDEVENISENQTLKKQRIFNQILKDAKDKLKINVHQIKFSLLSLKNLQKTKVTFDDMIGLLKQIENANIQVIQKHNKALKMLSYKPHQLLSKPFKEVYPKYLKKQELFQKIGQKFPNMQLYQLMKLQEAFEMDSLSQVSDIGSISEISDVQTDFLNDFFTKIQRTRLVLLPRVRLTPNGILYNGWSMEVASKILKHYRDYEYQFLKCQICDDQGKKIHNSPYILQNYTRKLMDKIKIVDEYYVPLGWSQSQLKQGALWYTLDSQDIKTVNREQILKFMGDFDDKKLYNPALKAARIGQNFGSSWSFDASEIKFIEEDDIFVENNKDKNFSDGIGCISEYNMLKFRQGLGLESLAAVQIRYKGVKGVLSLNKELPDNTGILRKSMIKYESTHPQSVKYFDVIDYSKYKVGYLNRQIIILLIANKVPEHQIIALQTQYIQRLQKDIFEIMFENISFDDEEQNLFENQIDKKFQSITEVFKMILSKTYQDKKNQVNKLIFDQNFFKALKIEAKRKLLCKLRQKCRIRVDKSVRLFGILDEFKVLGEYQVYCSIIKSSEQEKKNITGKCLLTKNPCMHPADIRVVTCVSDQQIQKRLRQKGKDPYLFQELVNVIIFPQKGKTPLTMEISQSDLDGDQFFLCWDQRIVPFKNMDPFVIAEQVPFIERNWTGSGYKQMLDFYVEFQNFNKLGRLANSHLIQADLRGAFCKECVKLCKTHSIAVQYPKRGYDFKIQDELLFHMYPHYMEKQHPLKSYRSTSILGKLYDAVLKESNLKGNFNLKLILENKKQKFWSLIQIYVNMNNIKQMREKSTNNLQINKIIEKYVVTQQQIQDADDQIIQNQQNQEPVSYRNVKREYQIEDKQLYKKKRLHFTKQNLDRLSKFISLSQKSKKYDMDQPFSLTQILTTFNYLSIFYFELKQLSQLLQNEHQSIYTVYFELQTSSKNKNNLFLLERINQLRTKWLKFFGDQLVSEDCFFNTDQFQDFYFNKLIEKKAQFQDSNKKFQKLKDFAERKNLVKKLMNEMKDNESKNADFIMDEIQNLKIIKKSLQYDTYTYSSLKDINPLIYRKLVLFYVVSNHFTQIIQLYNVKKLIDSDRLYFSDQEGKKLRNFLQNQSLPKALKFYQQNQIYFLGFPWFCLPKLMVIWWRNIFREEETKIFQKNKQKSQVQQIKIEPQVNKSVINTDVKKTVINKPVSVKPFQKKPAVYQKINHKDLIDESKCEIF